MLEFENRGLLYGGERLVGVKEEDRLADYASGLQVRSRQVDWLDYVAVMWVVLALAVLQVVAVLYCLQN